MQKDRAEILRSLLVANGGKMLAKDARRGGIRLSQNLKLKSIFRNSILFLTKFKFYKAYKYKIIRKEVK